MMDHQARAQSRILWQYRNGEKFRQWMDVLPAIAQDDLEKPLDLLANILDIDRQEGAQLDLLGRIVGVKRQLIEVDDATATFQLGDGQLGDYEAQLTSESYTATSEFGDALFRLLIRARIARNNSDGTIDDVSNAVQFITPNNTVRVTDNQNMTFELAFLNELTPAQRYLMNNYDIIPRPQGVRYLGYLELPLYMQLGGEDAQLGAQYAQLGDTPTGVN